VGAVLVHIDCDGDRPHPSSMTALAAGRSVASSWGATLYAALSAHDPSLRRASPDSTARVAAGARIPGIAVIQLALARAGADKVVVAVTDSPPAPLWASVGNAWQVVLDYLRPRLVLFGADAPSAREIGPRTAARIGARLLMRARATAGDHVELRDRDGGHVRADDGGAAVVLVGAARAPHAHGEDDVDLVVLAAAGGADPRIEVAGTAPAEIAHTGATIVAIGDDVAGDAETVRGAVRLARVLGAQLVGCAAAAKAGAVPPSAVVERGAPLAPELCVAVGTPTLDLAGAAALVRVGTSGGKGVDGALTGAAGTSLDQLVRALEATER
jgi:electron transfer flavoprotein alpha subunit